MVGEIDHVATLRLGKAISREKVSLERAMNDGDEKAEAQHKENLADLYDALEACDFRFDTASKVKETLGQSVIVFREPVATDPKVHKEQQSKMRATLARIQPFLRGAMQAKFVGGAVVGVGAGASIAALSILAKHNPILFTDGSVGDVNSLDIENLDGHSTTHLADTNDNGLLDWQYTTDNNTGWITEPGHHITQGDSLEDVASAAFHGIVDFFSNF